MLSSSLFDEICSSSSLLYFSSDESILSLFLCISLSSIFFFVPVFFVNTLLASESNSDSVSPPSFNLEASVISISELSNSVESLADLMLVGTNDSSIDSLLASSDFSLFMFTSLIIDGSSEFSC